MNDAITNEIKRLIKAELKDGHHCQCQQQGEFIRKLVRAEIQAALETHTNKTEAPSPDFNGYERTWTTSQVAEYLGIARKTVYNLASLRAPNFPIPRKHGRLNAFIPAEVVAYRETSLRLKES